MQDEWAGVVERLRKVGIGFCFTCCPKGTEQNWPHDPACVTIGEAADLIETLAKQNAEMREALQCAGNRLDQIVEEYGNGADVDRLMNIAVMGAQEVRTALSPNPERTGDAG